MFFTTTVSAADYYVNPAGADTNPGSTVAPFKNIQKAVDLAMPGDTVHLQDGIYLQDVISKRNGQSTLPITITGSKSAFVLGAGAARIVEINHDYIVLDGFTIDGNWGADTNSASAYRDKLIYIIGKDVREGVTGLKLQNMTIQNAGGECVRLRYFSHDNEIAHNIISTCGIVDFRFNGGGKNGEGIYVGTAPEQRGQNGAPTTDPDITQNNWIHDNIINTQGNECVDIKEDATKNIVERNDCTGQKDPESGGFDSRGNANVFRNNKVSASVGAGVRLGGDTALYGINNDVYNNEITNSQTGGIKFQGQPQGIICGNIMSGNVGGDAVGTYKAQFNPTAPCTTSPVPSDTPVITGAACRLGDANHDGNISLADYSVWRQIFMRQ
ncbi:DUF1565 domain-containing protein [Candidatus Microgenomates bacterium]|nr:DUF1565 domain-containing protein [Candidatus Microgenomates bacterium]